MLFFLKKCFGFGFLLAVGESHLGLDVAYHLGYFNIMCYMCDDNNNYRRGHKNAWQCLKWIANSHNQWPIANSHNQEP